MNILIIGNGFDLAHGLPTDYGSFLKFVRIVNEFRGNSTALSYFKNTREPVPEKRELDKKIRNFVAESFGGGAVENKAVKDIWAEKTSDKNKSDRIRHLEELSKYSENNMWIKWFNKTALKEKWVDFEAEISRFVQEFEKMSRLFPIKTPNGLSRYQAEIYRFIENYFSQKTKNEKKNPK